ncbi:family 16 glycoside hydrolase [Granulicella arctica]|uniref:FHA domain-containing protein n=1 Tax=Granulicella arctica TaxID=940613 RepID=A0A7Y9PF20_9BACT|nr:family 16 glycoside hydrolase [Granulicella arctica]NYF78679.1 hypothetical protein [Granulicella arctica]
MSAAIRLRDVFLSAVTVAVFATAGLTVHAQNKLSAAEVSSGWLALFDGSSGYGWDSSSGWGFGDQMLTSTMSSDRHIVTALPFGDFVLNFEYRLNATPSGAAVRIRAPHASDPADSGYRIPLGDTKPEWPAGSIVMRSKNTRPSPPLNAWHAVSIEANGGRIVVSIDGQQTAETTDESAKAGYIHFESTRGARLDLRNVYLKPLNTSSIFNGTDLSGWKSVPYSPKTGNGVGHEFAKMFGGGNGKPHTANWSVRGGAIHGESGPGSLESNNSYDDFVLQLSGGADFEEKKKDAFPVIYLRNEAGSTATGYPVGLGSKIGQIHGLAQPRRPIAGQGSMPQTVVAGGHVLGIYVNGVLETLYTDTRPEGATTKIGAKIKAGPLSIDMSDDVKSIDVHSVVIESIPHTFGGVVRAVSAAPPPTPTASAAASATPAQQSAALAAQTAQIAAALGAPTPQARQQVAEKMSQALKTSDPNEQMQLYDQVVRIDPSNAAAVQGYKEAAAKVAAQQQQTQQQETQAQQQVVSESDRDKQVAASLAEAQSSFLGGNIKGADAALHVAERLAPSNPLVGDLRSRINAALSLRHRLFFLGTSAGILALLGGGGLFWRARRQVRFPVLHVVNGLDQGRVYPVDRDVVRIGGIAQDGGQKNDIVIRDVEHMVSRFHCEVVKKDGNFFLVDTNSSNGTSVNGVAALPTKLVPLRKGSKIDLGGSTVLQFDFEKKKKA